MIGHTGFIGSNLIQQERFDSVYNSQNIAEIADRHFDLVVCAGARAEKWRINNEPEKDLNDIRILTESLAKVYADFFVLISTIDVYAAPNGVYEDTPVLTHQLHPYGTHRYFLEEFVRKNFKNSLTIRLPGMFGSGLKKNFIFDLLHSNALHMTHPKSRYQFYDAGELWKDIQKLIPAGISLINFATPPISAETVARECFDIDFKNESSNSLVFYDMRTRYGSLFGQDGDYIWTLEQELESIRKFVRKESENQIA